LIAVVLVAIAITAGLGYLLLSPKVPSPLVTYTTQQTSLVTSSESVTSTSPSPTTVVPETTLWINVTATKPVSYYVSLLKSTQTQPYVQLAWELQAVPDATNATAVAKITYLALNATNPEVKEAFQLMMEGGTPSPGDFRYGVPSHNTELQVLYWLALQNEFKKDDTLALSIAMVHGLWVTMGNEQVKQAVRNDSAQLLRYFRETNELQRQRGYYQLEHYPLEAKLCLAWTGSMTPAFGVYGLSNHIFSADYTRRKVDLKAYRWDAVNVTTLRNMRRIIDEKQWSSKDVDQVVAKIEYYFYFEGKRGFMDTWRSDHWIYSREGMHDIQIEIGGEKHRSWHLLTPNCQFDFYLQNGYVTGNCMDETAFVGAWLKSYGIASTGMWSICEPDTGHIYPVYYEASSRVWKAYSAQLAWYIDESEYRGAEVKLIILHIFKPPVKQPGYVRVYPLLSKWFGGNMCTTFQQGFTLDSISETFAKGVATSQMKEWLLYS
jgi:hypothetical protein